MINIDRILTDIFDFGADTYSRFAGTKKDSMPDVSEFDISGLITEEEMESPEKLYTPTDHVPDIIFKPKAELPFLDIYDGRFDSLIETPFMENNRINVRHFRIRNWNRNLPCVIMINGLHVNETTYFDWWCWRFAAWGMSSILFDIPYHIRRTPNGSFAGEYLVNADSAWTMLSLKQSYLDVYSIANWLKANGTGEIGTFGVSFGALMAGLYVCNAQNADFAIMGMPPMDALDTLGKISFGDEVRELERRGMKTVMTDERIPRVFNMSLMTPNVDTDKIFIGMGIYDHLVEPEHVEQTAEKWGGLKWLMKYPAGHINTFVLNLRFIRDARRFIKTEIV